MSYPVDSCAVRSIHIVASKHLKIRLSESYIRTKWLTFEQSGLHSNKVAYIRAKQCNDGGELLTFKYVSIKDISEIRVMTFLG